MFLQARLDFQSSCMFVPKGEKDYKNWKALFSLKSYRNTEKGVLPHHLSLLLTLATLLPDVLPMYWLIMSFTLHFGSFDISGLVDSGETPLPGLASH